jgi:hypothetical protein
VNLQLKKRKNMMSIQPQGEDLRRAVKWVSEEREYHSKKDIKAIVQQACIKFDLSPKDADFLLRHMHEQEE